MVLNRVAVLFHPPPKAYTAMSRGSLCCHNIDNRSTTGIQWIKAKDAAKHPIMHMPLHPSNPHKKELFDLNFNSVKVGKSWLREALLKTLSFSHLCLILVCLYRDFHHALIFLLIK